MNLKYFKITKKTIGKMVFYISVPLLCIYYVSNELDLTPIDLIKNPIFWIAPFLTPEIWFYAARISKSKANNKL